MQWVDATGGEGGMSTSLNGLRILIVDDDPDTVLLFTLAFEQVGAVVLTATSMAEALHAITHHRPDILLSDIQMPGQTGYTLIRQVRSLERDGRTRLPAIAVTACAGDDDCKQAIEAGFDRFLAKPVDLDLLITTVAKLTAFTAPRNTV